MNVSIQLIAPASGAQAALVKFVRLMKASFHSTDCPSEWGPQDGMKPCNALRLVRGFHSTDCPSEWGRECSGFHVEHSAEFLFPFN